MERYWTQDLEFVFVNSFYVGMNNTMSVWLEKWKKGLKHKEAPISHESTKDNVSCLL